MNPSILPNSNKNHTQFYHIASPAPSCHPNMLPSFDSSQSYSGMDSMNYNYSQKGQPTLEYQPEYPSPELDGWSEWSGQQPAFDSIPEQYFESQIPYSGFSECTPVPNRPTVLSWPLEYFVTNDPSLLTPGSDVSYFTSSDRQTPELLYTDSSCGDDNVFDMQFGDALASNGDVKPDLRTPYDSDSTASSPSASSPSSFTIDHPSSFRRHSPYKPLPSPTTTSSNSSSTSNGGSRVISASDHRRRFPCLLPGCDRRFTSQYTLKVHMEAHKPKPKVTFPCTHGCSERFSRQHDRLRHEVAKHGKVCEFSCEDCGRFFSTSKTLGNHKCPVAQGGTRWVNA